MKTREDYKKMLFDMTLQSIRAQNILEEEKQ